jgi:epoxyqueuosine reductase
LQHGFDACRITKPGAIANAGPRLDDWLSHQFHGEMDWMADHAERRKDPQLLWSDVRSILMLGVNYAPPKFPLDELEDKSSGYISVYARHRDYHDLIKGRLKQLAGFLVRRSRELGVDTPELKVFVDTAPVMEKPLAAASGLGWQGKHTNLVSREFGSWLFLGSIFTTLDLAGDEDVQDHCGSCQACLDVCPTGAFPAPYQLDARRCISYLTIEHKGAIDRALRPAMGNRIYGCDDCLSVCPWNKFSQASHEMKLAAREDLVRPDLGALVQLDDAAFRQKFAGGPIKRIGHARFIRNVLIAIGNSKNQNFLPLVHTRLEDHEPLIRAMAVWALSRLMSAQEFQALASTHALRESDEMVSQEWRAAMANYNG